MGSKAREAVPALTAAFNDRDTAVRRNAAGALGDLGPEAKAVVPTLRAPLKDKKRNVRETAAQPLKTIEGKE
jgi:HEAT repeat protein